MKISRVLVAGLLALGVAVGWAAVPFKINYEGRLTDLAGSALTGSYNMRFSITSDLAGGTVVWGPETHTGVAVSKGVFAVDLGATTPITTAELNSDTRYLKVEVANPPDSTSVFETLTPLSQIVSVAYAIKAQQAESLAGGVVSKLVAGANITLTGQQGEVTISAAGGAASTPPDDITIGLNGSSSLEVKNAGVTGAKLAANININTTGVVTAAAFVGDGSGITGVPAGNATSLEGHPAAYFAPVSDLAAHATAIATHGATSALVGIDDIQTLSNKTFTGTVTAGAFSGDGSALSGILTAATLAEHATATATHGATSALIGADDLAAHATDITTHGVTSAIVGTTDTQTLSNKSFTGTVTADAFSGDGSALSGILTAATLAEHATATATHGATSALIGADDLAAHATDITTHGVTSAIVGTTDTQTLSNKSFTGTVTADAFSGDGSALSGILTAATLAEHATATATHGVTSALVGIDDVQTLTNKIINTSGDITTSGDILQQSDTSKNIDVTGTFNGTKGLTIKNYSDGIGASAAVNLRNNLGYQGTFGMLSSNYGGAALFYNAFFIMGSAEAMAFDSEGSNIDDKKPINFYQNASKGALTPRLTINTSGSVEITSTLTAAYLTGDGSQITNVSNLSSTLNINTTGTITAGVVSATIESAGVIKGPNCMFTPEGGFAVRLINKTSANSITGTVISVTTEGGALSDMGFRVAPADSDRPTGVVYEAGIPDGQSCWVVVDGIAEVLVQDGITPTAGQWAGVSSTAGRAIIKPDPLSVEHNREIGHCLQTKSSGVDVLTKIVMHFN